MKVIKLVCSSYPCEVTSYVEVDEWLSENYDIEEIEYWICPGCGSANWSPEITEIKG